MNTYRELQNQLEQLQAKLNDALESERAKMIAEVKKIILEYGIQLSELEVGASKKHAKKASVARGKRAVKRPRRATKKADRPSSTMKEIRYRDPESGATWSGRGRMPRWMSGKNREQFAVTH